MCGAEVEMVNFTHRSLYPPGKESRYLLNKMLGRHQGSFWTFWKNKNFLRPAEKRIPDSQTQHKVTILLISSKVSDGRSNQNLMLFIRGNATSGAPSISSTSQFPKPPIMIGITMKKTMTKAWAVTMT